MRVLPVIASRMAALTGNSIDAMGSHPSGLDEVHFVVALVDLVAGLLTPGEN